MKKRLALAVLAGALCAASGCGAKPKLTVYCAAGLRPAVAEFIETFERKENIKVEPIYSGSGYLLSQIDLSQRGDVYIPGDGFFLQQAADKGYIKRQATAAYYITVIGVRKGNPKGVKGLADLAREDLKVGLGDEKACSVGRASAEMLAKAGLAGKVKPRYVSGTVNELGNHLQLGTLDAAIIWDAVAKFYPKDVDAVPIEPEWREVLPVPAGVLTFTKHDALAGKFVDAISGDEGRAIFAKNGYTVTIEKEAAK